ncbi:unnamed protein product [Polarella glacialis]|uniref:Uncharacterized protein n=1 Tax=Polarella glacialis TaxID=89957 RepID=A0A813DDC1_POLGL|nr:unnamed protein product [Polarella glacialis]
MISLRCPVDVALSFCRGLSRVRWNTDIDWELLLQPHDELLRSLTAIVNLVTEEMRLNTSIPVKHKRSLLDAAAWLRDAMFCVIGHCGTATHTIRPNALQGIKRKLDDRAPSPKEFVSCDEYKDAVIWLCVDSKSAALDEFIHLRLTDKAAASVFPASSFRRSKLFEISLTDQDTCQLMSTHDAIQAISDDLLQRAEHVGSEDTSSCDKSAVW